MLCFKILLNIKNQSSEWKEDDTCPDIEGLTLTTSEFAQLKGHGIFMKPCKFCQNNLHLGVWTASSLSASQKRSKLFSPNAHYLNLISGSDKDLKY